MTNVIFYMLLFDDYAQKFYEISDMRQGACKTVLWNIRYEIENVQNCFIEF